MAKAKPPEGKIKTDIVREYVRSNPAATGSQIAADLKAYRISLALAQKARYLEGLKRRGGGKKERRSSGTKVQPANGSIGGVGGGQCKAHGSPSFQREVSWISTLPGHHYHCDTAARYGPQPQSNKSVVFT
jgi:hypothetical protein